MHVCTPRPTLQDLRSEVMLQHSPYSSFVSRGSTKEKLTKQIRELAGRWTRCAVKQGDYIRQGNDVFVFPAG